MSLADTIMQIKYGDFKALEEAKADLTREVAALKQQLALAELSGVDGAGERLKRLFEAFSQAMEVVRFAIGNLHPLTVRGWPYEALQALSVTLPTIPSAERFPQELAVTFAYFAGLCEKWETARAEGREKEMLAEENAARAPSAATLAALGIVQVAGPPLSFTPLASEPPTDPSPADPT